jgi:plastocyanin
MSVSPRTVAALLTAGTCLLAACGAASSAAPTPASESLVPGIYGQNGVSALTSPLPGSASPSATASATPTPSPTPPAGPVTPCTSCGTVASGSQPATTVDATDQDVFKPQTVTITVGQVVQWKNTGTQPHTVTFPKDAAISDNLLSSGQTFEVKFTQVGNFYYQCSFHLSLGMTGTVNVVAG